ncbi:MAG: hypothetical protein WCF07_03000, partial [Nitrososphaeraceae archaeon]
MLAVDARDKNKDSLTQSRYEFKEKEARPRIYLVTEGLKSQATRDTYRIAFQIFLNDTVKNQDLSTLLDLKLTVIESKIISHIEYLRNVKKVKHSTIQTYISAIFHFFLMNDVALNIRKINRFYSEEDDEDYDPVRDRPYSIDEISKILDKADVRSKVIILLLASTGMRLGAIPGLKIGDLKQISEFGLYM